ncbi:MAG: hypothetical protein IPJ34_33960 [Myxococcales bacterium]|nr:hypothetical protein [Myxococcales bacterium]
MPLRHTSPRSHLRGAVLVCAIATCGCTTGGFDGEDDAAVRDTGTVVHDAADTGTEVADAAPSDAPGDVAVETADATAPCPTTPWATSYDLVPTVGPVSDRPADTHPDLNLKIRGFSPTTGTLGLIAVGGPTDALAPRLYTLLVDSGTPSFVGNLRVHGWDWGSMKSTGPITDPAVTMVAWSTTVGQAVRLPKSGYSVAPGRGARVLFLDDDSLTLKLTGEDNVVSGYTLHILDLCIEPNLRKAYVDANTKGRKALPALAPLQVFAKARGDRVRVAIRDTGSFMDPRVEKDWYQP